MSKITIQLKLSEQQAKNYLQWRTSQDEATMADLWNSDRYRKAPVGQRGPKVIEDQPFLAGVCCTACEYKKQFDTNALERAR